SSDPGSIRDAEFVILPGVGSARSAMNHLNDSGAASALSNRFRDGGAILGICLGLQLAMEHSEEDGGVTGLGLLSGDVVRLHETRVPRLGWSVVEPWGETFYFAHSYAVRSEDAIASVDGVTVAVPCGEAFSFARSSALRSESPSAGLAGGTVALRRDAPLSVQFHTEKGG